MKSPRAATVVLIIGFLAPALVLAGVFSNVVDCDSTGGAGNFCEQGKDDLATPVPAGAIVHPPGWDGTQVTLEVKVCVEPAFPELVGPTQRAVATWNALSATPANCPRCLLVEQIDDGEDDNRDPIFHAESAILHELGHCALGLGHSNLFFDDPRDDNCNPQDPDCDPESIRPTSFSASYDGVKIGVQAGQDGIRGSKDDRQDSILGGVATSVHWFRKDDNDPVALDGLPIDMNSFRVDTDDLPAGSTWPANANRALADQLGRPWTQAVMYSNLAADTAWFGLSADDVNMVKMGMTGEDLLVGGGDDYAVSLVFVPSCTGADIRVRRENLGPGELAGCDTQIFESALVPPPAQPTHYTVRGVAGFSVLELEDDDIWNFADPATLLVDGFATGDTSAWSGTSP